MKLNSKPHYKFELQLYKVTCRIDTLRCSYIKPIKSTNELLKIVNKKMGPPGFLALPFIGEQGAYRG